jgi:purine-binding chemotaxis protein CheW
MNASDTLTSYVDNLLSDTAPMQGVGTGHASVENHSDLASQSNVAAEKPAAQLSSSKPGATTLESKLASLSPSIQALFSSGGQSGENEAEAGARWLCFLLGEQLYAVEVIMVQEVVRVPDIAPVAGAPSEVVGVMNLRGQIVPVMNLRSRLALGEGADQPKRRVVVLEHEGETLGLMVDAVAEVFVAKPDSIQETGLLTGSVPAVWFRGLLRRNKDLVVALDAVKLLSA